MEELKALLNNCIEVLGTKDIVTILVSQKLDKLIVKEQRELINK
jgi:hypothetical protein